MNNLLNKFTPPIVSSTIAACPNPFHIEPYHGCNFNCIYCFSQNSHYSKKVIRDVIQPNNPSKLEKLLSFWAKDEKKSYKNPEKMFFKNRIPILIGTKSDPIPDIEEKLNITYDFLRIFDKYNYPVRILTKNPQGLVKVLKKFKHKLNIAVNISVNSMDYTPLKNIEPKFSMENRIKGIKELISMDYQVLLNFRPYIWRCYETAVVDINKIIEMLLDIKPYAFTLFPLQLRMMSNDTSKSKYNAIENDFYNNYKKLCMATGFYYSLKPEFQYDLKKLCEGAGNKSNIKYIHTMDCFYGCKKGDQECCGTERLKDYNLFNYNLRAKFCGEFKESDLIYCQFKGFSDIKGRGYNFNKKQTLKEYVDYRIENYYKYINS